MATPEEYYRKIYSELELLFTVAIDDSQENRRKPMLQWDIHFKTYHLKPDEHKIQSSRPISKWNINWHVNIELQIGMVNMKGIHYQTAEINGFLKSISLHEGKNPLSPRIQSQYTFFFIDAEQGMKHSPVFYLFKANINALALNLKSCFGQVHRERSYKGTHWLIRFSKDSQLKFWPNLNQWQF